MVKVFIIMKTGVFPTNHWISGFTPCCPVWLPFPSGEKWSIKSDKRYKEGELTVIVWRHACSAAFQTIRNNLRTPASITASLVFVEYFRGLHGEGGCNENFTLKWIKRGLTEVRSNQPVTQENESPHRSLCSHGLLRNSHGGWHAKRLKLNLSITCHAWINWEKYQLLVILGSGNLLIDLKLLKVILQQRNVENRAP